MGSAGIDLEVLPDGSESAVSQHLPRWRGRRRLIVGGALLVMAAVWLAFPVRSSLARSEVRRLEGQLSHAQALDNGRVTVMGKLTATAVLSDQDRVRVGDAALYREEVARLRAIQGADRDDLLVDAGPARLRTAMDRGLAAEIADLDRLAVWYSVTTAQTELPPPARTPATVAAIDRAYKLLNAQLHRFGLGRRPLPRAALFRSADPTLAFMSRVLNTPTGTRLQVSTTDGLVLVDIDANRITPARLGGLPAAFQNGFVLLARRGYVVLDDQQAGSRYWSAPPDLQGQVRTLGDAVQAVPAVDPDDVWLQQSDGTVVEANGQGAVLIGPIHLPNDSFLVGAVDAGLVVAVATPGNPNHLIVWDPPTRRVLRNVTTDATGVFAAGGDTVVWVQGTSGNQFIVHLTTVSSGQDRQIVTAPNIEPCGGQWTMSPDRAKIASCWTNSLVTGETVYGPGIIDVATARLSLANVALSQPTLSSIDWANSGDRIFFTDNNGPGTPGVFTYQLGSNTIEQLRLHGAAVLAIAVLSPDKPPGSP